MDLFLKVLYPTRERGLKLKIRIAKTRIKRQKLEAKDRK